MDTKVVTMSELICFFVLSTFSSVIGVIGVREMGMWSHCSESTQVDMARELIFGEVVMLV